MASYSGTNEGTSKYGSQASQAGSAASDMANDIGDKMSKTMEQAQDKLSRTGRDAADNAQAVATNLRAAIDKSIQDQPMTTLVMAAAAGFLIGALWRS